jgi:hypothetical protein
MVGVTAIASLKVAVMVTRFEPATILLGSVSVKVTVGAVLSMVKVILVVLAYASPERSVPETVAVTIPLVVVDTVQG